MVVLRPRALLRDSVYVQLRQAILDGHLAPGEQLRDQELSEWLGASRTPVREALTRLEDEGLVESAPQRYTRVTQLNLRAARDAFVLVAALHALAAELGAPHLDPTHISAMRAANARLEEAIEGNDVDAAIAADDAFHAVLVDAAGNGELEPLLERLMPRLRRLERLRFGSLSARTSARQHEEIIRLARVGQPAALASAVRENWLTLSALIDQAFHQEDA